MLFRAKSASWRSGGGAALSIKSRTQLSIAVNFFVMFHLGKLVFEMKFNVTKK